ncbi:MAG TPA: hypothetical protein VNJ07_00075 [Chitinophagales bacterium]|nr:hypothetical protein [Chitinophagales bacterium]
MMKPKKKKSSGQAKPLSSQRIAFPEPVFWKQYRLGAAILFVLPFLLYGYSITFGYVLDDEVVASENKFVKKGLAGIWDILSTESFTGYWGNQTSMVQGARYRPLSIVTFALEYQIFGLNPHVSHFINVLLYALTGILLLKLLSLLFPLRGKKWFSAIPFAASMLYIAHPLHSEAVANIKGRDEILSFLLSLGTLYASYQFLLSEKKYLPALSAALFLLALLAKENAITFLAVIPLTSWYFQKTNLKKLAYTFLPLLATAAVYLIIRREAIGYLLDSGKEITGLMNNPFLGATSEQKYATIFYTLGLYVKLLFFPHPLTHDYYPYQIPLITWDDARAFIPLIFYFIITGYALIFFQKKTIASYCILYFLSTLSIASNIAFNIGTFMNERFLYMPSLGFCILVAYWLTVKIPSLFKNNSIKTTVAWGAPLLLTVAFSAKTMSRVPDWKDILTLDRAAVKISANSARINCFYGYDLYKEAQKAAGAEQMKLVDEAMFYIDRALKIYPTYPDALNAKAGLLALRYQNDHDLDKLLEGFYKIQTTGLTPFIDEYLDFLERTEGKSKLVPFYQRLGRALKKTNQAQKGDYYLKKAQ